MKEFNRGKAWVAMIKSTEDPNAPQIVERAYGAAQGLGRLLAGPKVDEAKVHEYTDRLMKDWSGPEMNKVCSEPEFLMALCGMLAEGLVTYTRKLAGDPSL